MSVETAVTPQSGSYPGCMNTQRTSYADIAYGAHARARQAAVGADNKIVDPGLEPFVLDGRDRRQIREADTFFLATVTDTGWPYVQHKGGPAGFVHVLDDRTLAFPDFPGNEQFVTAGNLDRDGRVCLFFVDFPTRRRIKVFGHARIVEAGEDPALVARVRDLGKRSDREIRTEIERVIVVDITDLDANCTRHIRPRWDRGDVEQRISLYRAEIAELKARVAELEDAL